MMNLLTTIAAFFLFLQVEVVSFRAECINMDSDGKVTMKIWDKELGRKYKISDAEYNAVERILYDGFHNKNCGFIKKLLINRQSKIEFEDTHMYFFKKSGKCKDYVISSKLSEEIPDRVEDKDWKVYEVVVNKKTLDQHLVDSKIKFELDTY